MESIPRKVERAPTANLLVQKLPGDEQAQLRELGRMVTFSAGELLTGGQGRIAAAICFPEAGILSVMDNPSEDQGVEIAMIGREGMLGWPLLLCDSPSAMASVVRYPGRALVIPSESLREAAPSLPHLRVVVSRFVQSLTVQMGTTIASGLRAPVGARVARRLLMLHDRWENDVLDVTHQQVAAALGIRRASVTDHLHLLEGDHIVRCTRGRIEIIDRPGLEATARGSYGDAEASYRRLLSPFGKSAVA